MRMRTEHQFIERATGKIRTESLYADKTIRLLYSVGRENAPFLFHLLTKSYFSRLLAFVHFDIPLNGLRRDFLSRYGIDLTESVDSPDSFDNLRRIFERKIRYWECRPMRDESTAIVSPADSRVLVGSFRETSQLFVKNKFFELSELLGKDKPEWTSVFQGGDFAIFRLTPEKYHYNHTPVEGQVAAFYEICGDHHSCNPTAVVEMVTPYSKNKRVVTVFDTDVPGGSHVGFVAMIEIVALMIGDIVQAYSQEKYEDPKPVTPGMLVKKGCPKSLYRPGSSTDVLIFQKGRTQFADDLIRNMYRAQVKSRFSKGFAQPLIETDLQVRSLIATAVR